MQKIAKKSGLVRVEWFRESDERKESALRREGDRDEGGVEFLVCVHYSRDIGPARNDGASDGSRLESRAGGCARGTTMKTA